MSFDLDLYAARAFELPPLDGLSIDGPLLVQTEDIEPGIAAVVGKRRLLWQIHLTDVDWPLVEAWVSQVLSLSKGVIIDLQANTFETATKRGHLRTEGRARPDPVWMNFWFSDGERFHAEGLAQLLATLAEIKPKALPQRYGFWEPLQHKVEGDFAPLLQAFAEEPKLLLQAKTPFGGIHLSIPCKATYAGFHPDHWLRSHFLLARLSFEVKPTEDLREMFERLCLQLDVVYAEITGPMSHAAGSWFWRGLPDGPKRAICIGPNYRRVWPEAQAFGYEVGTHRLFYAARDGSGLPPIPPALVAPYRSLNNRDPQAIPEFAPLFPFDFSFDPNVKVW